jgi:non-canonical purine NTP pyrophosphatase (RdgB/HAM1 family)
LEIVIAIVFGVLATLIGGWQILLAWKQLQQKGGTKTLPAPHESASASNAATVVRSGAKPAKKRRLPKVKGSSVLFVSNNPRKLEEYRLLLDIPDLTLSKIDAPDPQHSDLVEFVKWKIDYAREILPKDTMFFVEHTALMIDGWNGFPGGLTGAFIRTVSASVICKMMKGFAGNGRSAKVKTVIGFWDGAGWRCFEGAIHGAIAEVPSGDSSFGWDNIFIPAGERRTFAEIGPAGKNGVSMRKQAAESFSAYLKEHFEII